MNQCDQHHVVSESTFSFPTVHMHNKNTPLRLQCDIIPNAHLGAHLESYIDPSSSSTSTRDMHCASSVDSNLDHIVSLELSLCSDFVCCGMRLRDLHALLEHYEEDHVLVLAPSGQRMRLDPMFSSSNTPASSRSSSATPSSPSALATPPSSAPPSPTLFSQPTEGPFASTTRKSSMTVAPVYTPFTPSLHVDPSYPFPDTTETVMAHEPIYDEFSSDMYPVFAKTSLAQSALSHEHEDVQMAYNSSTRDPPAPADVYDTDKAHPVAAATPKQVKFARTKELYPPSEDGSVKSAVKALNNAVSLASSSKISKTKNRFIGSGNHLRNRREKAYHCPTPRCSKSYLNPNGLKYHMEKGTCKIEEGEATEWSEDGSGAIANEPMPTTPPSSTSTSAPLSASSATSHPSSSTPPRRALRPTPNAYPPTLGDADMDSQAQLAANASLDDLGTPPTPKLPPNTNTPHRGSMEDAPSKLSSGEIPIPVDQHSSAVPVPVHPPSPSPHQPLHSSTSPKVNFNESASASDVQGQSVRDQRPHENAHAPGPHFPVPVPSSYLPAPAHAQVPVVQGLQLQLGGYAYMHMPHAHPGAGHHGQRPFVLTCAEDVQMQHMQSAYTHAPPLSASVSVSAQ
ncbi:hypothetical protein BDZ97DRAFT_1022607 [Flammula alnicola]|nr:hypothetical protein BDZ97DRAFT_1022607 [Flammula alnicola]